MKRVNVFYKDRKIKISVKRVSNFGKYTGLMFSSSKKQNLLFDFSRKSFVAIHSLFVFYPFLALWLNEKNSVIERAIIRPFTFLVTPKNRPSKLVEIPLNKKNSKIIEFFVGKGKV